MRRARRAGLSNQNAHVRSVESEDSDEDYVAEVDDMDDQSDELDSLVGDASEEGSCFDAEEEEEEEEEEEAGWRRVVKPRAKKGPVRNTKKCIKRPNKRRVVKSEDEEESNVMERSNRRRVFGSDDDSHVMERSSRRRDVKSDDEEDCHVNRRVVRSGNDENSHVIQRSNKRKRVVRSDEEEDSDDDDKEFTPEECLEEEEEEEEEEEDEEEEEEDCLMLKMDTRKRGRFTSKTKAKTSRKSRSKRNVKAVRKPRTKKSSNCNSLWQRVKSNGDEDFIGKGPTRGRSNKKSVCKKKRVTTGSDSDFCSDSSDYEFTISEEEREQVREANNFCGNLAPTLRSSRRIQEDEALYEPKKPPARKGKEKAVVIKNDVGQPVCGICLTEEGKNTVRGTLNCCSHYFCFACIFEWSKVETRCPLCKQRFASISKPARWGRGFDLRDTVIPVPERDQVYQPSEEELRDFLNPYENVICTECDQGGDDALMLLCDLCDSPAHTYCVGLGHEVPEGNWYCDGCRPAALGSSHSLTQDLTPVQRTSTGVSDGMSTYENMAEIDLNVTIPETTVSQGNGFLSSPRFAGGSIQVPSPVSGMGVSTVSGRRQIHRQIRYILSNRLSQISPGADMSALGNLIGRGVDSTQQQSRTTDVGPSHHSPYVDRLQERPLNSVQNRDTFPGRLGHIVRQIGLPSTSANSVYTQVHWNGRDRLSLGEGQSRISVGETLRPCTSRSSIGPNIGVSPSNNSFYEEHANFVKQRVHSLVRVQLKSLSREMNLGHNNYVEISRRSAHTIMAACGLEPRMHDTYEAQPPTCLHLESRLSAVETSPVNGCCLACFEGFVKDIVKRITDIVLRPHWFGIRH